MRAKILISGLAFLLGTLALVVGALSLAPEAGEAQTEPPGSEFKALVFTKTAGFRHDSIPSGVAMFRQMATENNFEMVHTEDSTIFNDQDLAQFDVLVMFQTSGDVWNAEQKAALERYQQGGGGVVAIHNAADMRNGYQWWDDLIGTTMTQHSAGGLAGTIKVADKVHPSTAGLPDRWQWREEWYNFDQNPRGDVHVLATADETTYDAGPSKMGADHPISWCHDYDGGRAWITGLGHHDYAYNEPLFQKHLLGGLRYAADVAASDCGGTQWSNFEKVTLDDATKAPMELDVAPDGRVFYVERLGELMVYKPDSRRTLLSGDVPVYTGGEDGLVGMALDPNFGQNNWIYLYYSPPGSEAVNRLSRFTVVGDQLDLSSEKKLLDVPAGRTNEPGHTGGGVEFGPNGDLYLSVGDDVNPFQSDGYAPIDERPGRKDFDAQGSSANTNDLRGKILRIHPEADGSYTIPNGNMFPEAQDANNKTRPEIYAMGFRNPFRFKVDEKTGAIVMADYGPDNGQANPGRGPDGKVEWNRITKPGFYGWPYCTANNLAYNDYNFATGQSGPKFDCQNPVNDSPNNTGLTNLPPIVPADIWYGYGAQPEWPEMGSGGAAPMGGPVYRYDPNLDSDTKWPEYYDGAAIFGEWARNYLREIRTDGSGKVLKVNPLLSDMVFKSPMDMEFGPDGSLYSLEWGGGYGIENPESGLYRIDYVKGTRSPIATAKADKTSGPAPLTVRFSSEGSRDPDDGDTIAYSWDLDGDGDTDSTEASPTFTYERAGDYKVQLTVTDSTGRTGTANISITAGNTAPVMKIEAPENGAFIDFGDQVRYRVTVTDPEDGPNIDCSKVTVTPSVGHDSHAHPLDPVTGCEGIIQTEEDGHSIDANIFFVLNASYKDNGAPGAGPLTASDQHILQPKHKQAEHFAGANRAQAENQSNAVGGKTVGGIGSGSWFSFKPTNLKNVNAITLRVSSATAASKVEVRQDAPDGPLVATANLKNTGGYNTFADLDPAPVTDAAGGTHELFFVAVGGAFTVDEVHFNGKGISENGRPVVEAKATPTSGTAPLDVSFTADATDPEGMALTYAWDFGVPGTDADKAAGKNASYTYRQAGTYEAALTVTDAGGARTVERIRVRVFPALEGEVYVSDIEWRSATNGWGPPERDRSNGEQGASDGNPLTINETAYQKGVGAHANSEIAISLGGKCQTFTSFVGIDDEVSGGSVVFRVLADDRVVAQTPTLNAQSPATELTADVAGAQVLKLVVTDGGNGNGEDHADWAEAKLRCGPAVPPNTAPEANNDTATTNAGEPADNIAVLDNDSDPDGDALSVEDTADPANGTASANADGTVRYAPDPGFTGEDTFAYTVSDGNGGTDSANVTVTVVEGTAPDTAAPVIKELSPQDGAGVRDRTPRVGATVLDRVDDLNKDNLEVYVDGRNVGSFDYFRGSDRLAWTPGRKMDFGRHTVRVAAEDSSGNRASTAWDFRVVRP